MAKKIIVTGISGTNTKEFCRNYVMGMDKGKVRLYHTAEMLYKYALGSNPIKPPFPKENLLNLQPDLLESYRDRVLETIVNDLDDDAEKSDRIIIDTHAQFLWNNISTNAYNPKFLNSIDADMYITLIDKPSDVKEKQMQTQEGRDQDHGLKELLYWENIEVNTTQSWAMLRNKPMYVLPTKQDPIIIEDLLDNWFLIYFQMPMTEANSEQDQMISEFKEKLLRVGFQFTGRPTPIIDPRHIDVETGESLDPKVRAAIRKQCTHRDENWYIPEVTDQVAYYPKGTSISKGVSDETTRGHETGNNTFVIFQNELTSPFMDIAKKVFTSEEEFFRFFKGYMETRLDYYERNKWRIQK